MTRDWWREGCEDCENEKREWKDARKGKGREGKGAMIDRMRFGTVRLLERVIECIDPTSSIYGIVDGPSGSVMCDAIGQVVTVEADGSGGWLKKWSLRRIARKHGEHVHLLLITAQDDGRVLVEDECLWPRWKS